MAPLHFTAKHDLILDGQEFAGGEYELEDASPELHKLVAHCAAAAPDACEIHEGGDFSLVQSQEDGEKAYAEAVESGDWQIGHELQAAADHEAREAANAEIAGSQEIASEDVADAHEVLGGEV